MTNADALLASPPADSPWADLSATSRTGASRPMDASPGRIPMPAVANDIRRIMAANTCRRPRRSPRRPNSTAPTGRKRNALAKIAKVASRPVVSLVFGKYVLAMTVAKAP
jgi:hypothetical protein